MMFNRWRFPFLPLLVLAGAGVAIAVEAVRLGDQPQATAEVSEQQEADRGMHPEALGEPAGKPEVSATTDEILEAAPPSRLLPAAPPPSLQTRIDERRDQHRRQREALFGAARARYPYTPPYMPPWMATYDRSRSLYRDGMRQSFRRQRDDSTRHRDSWMDAMCPWSKPQRNQSWMRNDRTRMDPLDRQQVRDAWPATRPYLFGGPVSR